MKYLPSVNYLGAVGAAGGTLVSITVLLHVKVKVIMWMLMKKNRALNTKRKKAWTCCLVLTEIAVGVLLLITVCFFVGPNINGLRMEEAQRSTPYPIMVTVLGLTITQGCLFGIAILHSSYFSLLVSYFNWNIGKDEGLHNDIEAGAQTLLTNSRREYGTRSYSTINDDDPDESAI